MNEDSNTLLDSTSSPKEHSLVRIEHLPDPTNNFVGREQLLKQLNDWYRDPATQLVELVAFGGVGKSSLVAEWLKTIGRENSWLDARFVFGHSFYSQGSRADTIVSSEEFLTEALTFFGDDTSSQGSPSARATRLAKLIRNSPTILVLDGIEPLQEASLSPTNGKLTDPGLLTLISELSAKTNDLVVVTTRVPVRDLKGRECEGVAYVELSGLTETEGVSLLKSFGVTGDESELKTAARDYEGHSLSLTLLATFLVGTDRRKIEDRYELDLLDIEQLGDCGPTKRVARNFTRIMQRYELWLASASPEANNPNGLAREVLRISGLFDRPITKGEFEALSATPISGLTELLHNASEDVVYHSLNFLERLHLVGKRQGSREDRNVHSVMFDTHPLIREYFANQLSELENSRRIWKPPARRGHAVLREFIESCGKAKQGDCDSYVYLYRAIAHGCKANQHEDVYQNILLNKVRRGNELRSTDQLGLYAQEKAALFSFFEGNWSKPSERLSIAKQFELCVGAGYVLRALGDHLHVTKPLRRAIAIEQADACKKARAASLLASTYSVMGQMKNAIHYAQLGLAFADGDHDATALRLASLGEVLHWCGKTDQAEKALNASESMRLERPTPATEHSLGRHNLGQLLLDAGRFVESVELQGIDHESIRIQTRVLNETIRARGMVMQELQTGTISDTALHRLHLSVFALRDLASCDYLVRNLLWKANLFLDCSIKRIPTGLGSTDDLIGLADNDCGRRS